jgi:hypothetical protein
MLKALPPGEVIAPAAAVRRRPPRHPALHDVVSSVWLTHIPADVTALRVLPDAAVDLIFAGQTLVVAGPDTSPFLEHLPPGRPVLGFQLRPSAVPAVLRAPASAIRDERVTLSQLWGSDGRDLTEHMVEAGRPAAAAAALEGALVGRIGELTLDPVADVLVRGTSRERHSVGLGERQLRRRCTAAFGYGPRTLARIVRFQSAVEQLRTSPQVPLATVAAAAGYVDQAHLAHEIADFSGLTPRALRTALTA